MTKRSDGGATDSKFDQPHDVALGAPRDRPRQMEGRRRGRSARQHEGAKRREVAIELVDLALEAFDLGVGDPQRLHFPLVLFGGGEVGAEIEEVVLDPRQHGVDAADPGGMEAGAADGSVGLVDGADRLDSRIGLRPPLIAH